MSSWTPSIVPTADQTVYLVIGRCWRETDAEQNDLQTIIVDMLRGEYSNPVRIVGFNAAEGWSRDVSEDVACELRYRCDRRGIPAPANLEGFMDAHENRDRRQLRLV